MNNVFSWMKSTRSIIVTIFVLGMTGGLFFKLVTAEQYMNGAMLALGAYFGKRDSLSEQGGSTSSETTTTTETVLKPDSK